MHGGVHIRPTTSTQFVVVHQTYPFFSHALILLEETLTIRKERRISFARVLMIIVKGKKKNTNNRQTPAREKTREIIDFVIFFNTSDQNRKIHKTNQEINESIEYLNRRSESNVFDRCIIRINYTLEIVVSSIMNTRIQFNLLRST